MTRYNDLIFKYKKEFKNDTNLIRKFLFELCNEKGIDLYYCKDEEADKDIEKKFEAGVKRLLNDEPLNYVLGYSYFYGYKIKVTDKVLIPRFETEELVSHVLACYDSNFKGKKINVCDIGTGSGAIAIALKNEEDNMNIFASDISKEAIDIAKENSKNNKCKINYYVGNMLDPLIENVIHVDILISNPPYIKINEEIENSVKDYEPHVALFGGEDGLKFYKEILSKADKVLNPNGFIFFEIGYDQKETLSKYVKSIYPSAKVDVFKDINGKNRVMKISL